jgi:tetratricopeptide (TPR) repeat protein/class 3 adenylate cyclase
MFEDLDRLIEDTQGGMDDGGDPTDFRLKEGERRIVSVLFADLKGFSALSEKLDPEEIHALMDRTLKIFSFSIQKFGGYIDKYEGDRIMALFGAKQASERDTERAVLTGRDMLEKLKNINDALADLPRFRDANIRLSLRIGINTGLVTTERVGVEREGDFTAYGDAVVLASHMEKSASINAIMLPLETKQLVERRFEFDEASEIHIQGRSSPVKAFMVKGRKRRHPTLRNARTSFVGRDEEMAFLSHQYGQAQARIGTEMTKPVVVGVKGSAGIGKTRLICEFLRNLPEVFEERSYYYGETDPYVRSSYELFIALIRDITGLTDADSKMEMKDKLDESFEELSKSIPAEGMRDAFTATRPLIGYLLGIHYDDVRLRSLKGKTLQDQIHLALRRYVTCWIDRSNRRGLPCVIVLENLHWIDSASCTMLELFMNTLNVTENGSENGAKHLFLIVSYRPEFVLPGELRRQEFTELTLNPLSDHSSKRLIQSLIGDSERWELQIPMIIEKSSGNPFYIEEWLRFIFQTGEVGVGRIPVPVSLNSLVLSRIDRLGKTSRLLLQKASVIGPRFTGSMLAQIERRLDRNEDIAPYLDDLEEKGWIEVDRSRVGSYRFSNAITQEISYNTLLIHNREILHRVIADILEEEGDLPENYMTIYTHYRQTTNRGKRIEYGVKAGDRLKSEYQNREALRIFKEVLDQLAVGREGGETDLLTRIDILLKIANVLRTMGKWAESEQYTKEALTLAQDCGDEKRIGSANRHLGWLCTCKGNYEEAIALLETSLRLLEDAGDRAGLADTLSDMGVVWKNRGEYEKAMACYREELSICEELGDIRGISKASGNMGIVHFQRYDLEKAIVLYERELRLCEEIGDLEGIARAVCNLGGVYKRKGELERAVACFRRHLVLARQMGDRRAISSAICNIGTIYNEMGNYEKARQCFRQDRDICEKLGDRRGLSIAIINLGALNCDMGDFDRAKECFEQALELCENLQDKRGIATSCANLGNIYLELEQYEMALGFLERGIEICRAIEYRSILAYCLILTGETHYFLKDYHSALSPVAEALRIANEIGLAEQVLECGILTAKIDYASGRAEDARIRLRDMLDRAESEEEQALLNYELAKVESERKGISETFRKAALELYRRLDEQSTCSEYREKIRELDK